jgi:hypothetical protein
MRQQAAQASRRGGRRRRLVLKVSALQLLLPLEHELLQHHGREAHGSENAKWALLLMVVLRPSGCESTECEWEPAASSALQGTHPEAEQDLPCRRAVEHVDGGRAHPGLQRSGGGQSAADGA